MKYFNSIKYFIILFFFIFLNITHVKAGSDINKIIENSSVIFNVNEKLTLFDLIDLALKNNSKTKLSYNNILLMNNKIINNKKLLLPDISWQYNKSIKPSYNKNNIASTISLNNIVSGVLKNKELQYEKLIKEFEHNEFVNTLILNVIKNYLVLLSLKESENALYELQKYSEKVLEIVSFKNSIGLTTVNEKLSAEITHSNNHLKLLKTQNNIKEVLASLNNLLGFDANTILPINLNSCDIDLELKSYEEYLQIAISNNQDLNILYNKKIIENLDKKIHFVSMLPHLSFYGSSEYIHYKKLSNHELKAGFTVSFSLNNAVFYSNDLKMMDKNIANIDLQVEQKKKEISLEVWNMYNKCKLDIESFKNITEILHYSNKNLDLQIGMYKSNKVGMVELLEAYSQFASSKSDYISIKFEMLKNRAEFLNYLNILNFTNVKEIINFKGVENYDNIQK